MGETATHPSDWLLRLGLVAVAGVQSAKRLADFDLPWHLALGRHVLETRSVPKVDPLAFTHRPIGYMEFATDTLFHAIFRAGGPLALQLLGALSLIAVVLVYLRRAREAGPMALPVLSVLVVGIGSWVLVRPATVSFLFLTLFALALERHREAPDASWPRGLLIAMVPLTVLWANAHGFVVLGVALLAGYAAYRTTCRLAGGCWPALLPPRDALHLGLPWGVAVGSALASGANLAGFRLWTGPMRASGDFGRIAEWHSPDWSTLVSHELGFAAFLGLGALALAFGREADGSRLPNAFDLGLWLVALVLGQSAFRMLPVAALLVAPLIARRLAAATQPSTRLPWLAAATVPLAAPLLALNLSTSIGVGFEPRHFPERAVQWIEKREPAGRMWNFLPFGGYLALRLHPRHLVLVDGRSGWVHDPALLARYHASEHDPAAFEALATELELQWAVTRAAEGERFGEPLAASQAWSMVFLDDVAAIYVRRDGPNRDLGGRGYRTLRHLVEPSAVLAAAVRGTVAPDALAHDGRLAVEQAPQSPRAHFFDVCGAIALRDGPAFHRARLRLAKVAPGHPAIALVDATASDLGLSSP